MSNEIKKKEISFEISKLIKVFMHYFLKVKEKSLIIDRIRNEILSLELEMKSKQCSYKNLFKNFKEFESEVS